MRAGIIKTVAARVIILMLAYAVVISSVIISFGYYIIDTTQRRIYTQSTESNLQMAAESMDRDLVEIIALAAWCGRSNPPARFLTRPYDPIEAVTSFTRLQEEKRNNRANRYIRRVLIINDDGSKVLHLSDNGSNPLVLPGYGSEERIKTYPLTGEPRVYGITPDPFDRSGENVLNILAPVYSTSGRSAAAIVGTVYVAADVSLITDALKGYVVTETSPLFLTVGGMTYQLDGAGNLTASAGLPDDQTDSVSCEIREGIFLTQYLDRDAYALAVSGWIPMLIAVCGLVLALSAAVIITMNRTVSLPVARIRKKAEAIANGDFSPDPAIESDSEIGEVGRGLNKLSRDVSELMERRVTDEQNKRELEYRMLQSQISPHFLYNTLSSIKWMATLQKSNGIAEMTTSLSRLLKTTAKDLRKVVPLKDEIALLDDYYTILKYRYGGMIEYEKNIENENLLECALPRFVLQPLMENAIFHGIEPKGKGRLTLNVAQSGECVCVTMCDDGVGFSTEELARVVAGFSAPQEGAEEDSALPVGLSNVHRRIQNVFGNDYGLTVESTENAYTGVTIRVPFTTGRDLNV